MQPETFLLTDVGQRSEIIDGAGVGRARRANDAEWQVTISAILRDSPAQRLQVNLETVINWYESECIPAQAQQFRSLVD
jgi:hypothetical protein